MRVPRRLLEPNLSFLLQLVFIVFSASSLAFSANGVFFLGLVVFFLSLCNYFKMQTLPAFFFNIPSCVLSFSFFFFFFSYHTLVIVNSK